MPSIGQLHLVDIVIATRSDLEKIVFVSESEQLPPLSKPCDIGIVLGGSPSRIVKALELYRKGRFKKFLVAGGIGPLSKDRKTPEAQLARDYLVKNGVPLKDIFVEGQSRNTVENITLSLAILRTVCQDFDSLTFLVITSHFHVRRGVQLLCKQINSQRRVFWYGVQDNFAVGKWSQTRRGRFLIRKEAFRLWHYVRTLKIKDFVVPGDLSFLH